MNNIARTLLHTLSSTLAACSMLFTALAQSAPILDTTFGTQGIARIGTPSGYEDVTTASTLTPDGKVIVAGSSSGRQNYAFVTRFTTAGIADATFGNNGSVLLPPPSSHVWMTPVGVDVAAGGSIIVTSVVHDGFVLTRLTSAGVVDASFGNAGSVFVADVDAPSGSNETAPIRTSIQADGSLIVLSDASRDGNFVLRFRRFLANGTLDTTYGNAGVRTLAQLPQDFVFTDARKALVEPNGGFTLLAVPSIGTGTYLVVRVTAQGALDTTFGGVGYRSGFDIGNPSDQPTAIVRVTDGGYVLAGIGETTPGRFEDLLWKIDASGGRVAGYGGNGRAPAGGLAASSRVLTALPDGAVAIVQALGGAQWRFGIHEANGSARPGFGTAGGAMVPIAGYLAAHPIGLHADGAGRLTAAGWASKRQVVSGVTVFERGNDAVLASVSASGQPRTDFGRGDGIGIWNNPAFSSDRVDSLLVDPQGRIDIAGFSDANGTFDYLVARLSIDGAPDVAFATDGRLTPGISARFVGVARAAVQPNGGIVVATGEAGGSFGSVRSATIFRASVNGALDGNFRPAILPAGPNGTPGLAIRPDGRVLYATNEFSGSAGTSSYVLQQFLPDGSPDTSFGVNGRATFVVATSFDNAVLADIALLPDGSVLFAAFTGSTVHVFKVDATGKPVTAFNGGRQSVTTPEITYNVATNARILALADGGLVTVSAAYATQSSGPVQRLVHVVRYSATGSVVNDKRLPMDASSNTIAAVALPDASVVIARVVAPGVATLARLLPDNQFDQGFGGESGTPVTFTAVSALALDATGLVVGGQDASSALVARYRLDGSVTSTPAVEFFNPTIGRGHYFVTAGPGEIAIIEAGGAGPGWQRTANDFRVWIPETGVPVGAVPVCRFYGTPGRGPNSHFYTASADECAAVKRDPGWTYEGIAFYVRPPINDQCPGSTAVYRAYNNGFASNDSNHRYSTQRALLQAMTSQGWSVEGVAFCGSAN